MPALLFFAASVEDRRGADRECRRVENHRQLIAARCVVERLLIRDWQPQTPVLARETDTGESAVVELLLECAGPQPWRLSPRVGLGRVGGVVARLFVREPRAGP